MPFLGLYSSHFDETARKYFHDRVLGTTSPIRLFIRGLNKWPAVFATYLTVHVVEGYGRSGTGEVYPFIESALGASAAALDQRRRIELWKEYRKACLRLGLSVVPEGSSSRPYVTEYLRQAGVPIKYLASLAVKLESHAARLGIPDIQDPESVTAWQEQLRGYLGSPLSKTIPLAIEADDTAYYTTTYLKVRGYDSANECQNETESAIYEGLVGSPRTTHVRAAEIPDLQWRNGAMGIQIPGGAGTEWRIRTALHGIRAPVDISVVAEDERQFVPLPDGFPLQVEVSRPSASFEFQIWEDIKDNRVLLVDRLGHIQARASLGGNEVRILPGTYSLVTRWDPLEEHLCATAVVADPAVFESTVTIGPGETLSLQRGPANIAITGKSVAALEWRGLSKTGVLGREMLAGKGLSIIGTIPEEIESAAPGMFEVVISAQDIDKQAEIGITLDEEQAFEIDLSEILSSWPFELLRLGAVIRRRDIPNRSFARISGLVWNGLSSTDGIRFKCESKDAFDKSNIDRSRCENTRFDEDGLTFRDNTQRYFRTVFDLSPNETVAFTWLVPGLFLSLVEYNGQLLEERPLAKASVIQVKPSSRAALKIYSTLEGVIKLGGYQKVITTSSLGGMQMYLAPILEHLSADDRKLQFFGVTGVAIPLVEIVAPHQFTTVATYRSANNYRVTLEVTDELDDISIEAIEMVSGKRESIELRVNVLESATGRAMQKVWAISHDASQDKKRDASRVEINWPINDWDVGAYVFRVRAKIADRWGELVNARGDSFVGSMTVPTATEWPLKSVKDRSRAELLDIFCRFTEFLLECYAEEGWSDLKWIASAWEQLAQRLEVTDPQILIRLCILALQRAPEHSPASWAPINYVASARLDVFAQPAQDYQRLPSGEMIRLGILRSLGEFAASDSQILSGAGLFASLAILGFDNGPRVANGASEKLRQFSLEKFAQIGNHTGESERRRIRRREEWTPEPGIFLGATHYWWAVNKLETKLQAGFSGNEYRRGNALRLAGRLMAGRWRERLPRNALRLIEKQLSLGLLYQRSSEDEISQGEENISSLIDLISVTAFACRFSARQPDFLADFQNCLADELNSGIEQLRICLGYALYIGIDVFLYYLLLWEFVLSRDFDEESNIV